MLKKISWTIIVFIIFILLLSLTAYLGKIRMVFSWDEGFGLHDYGSINNIIDYYVDADGNYYYLDFENGNTFMYKLTGTGELLFRKKMPSTRGDTQKYYKQIIVADNETIYVLVSSTLPGSRLIYHETIKKYDARGNYLGDEFFLELDEPMEIGNPFSPYSGRLINIKFVNDSLFAFYKRNDNEIVLLNIKNEKAQERKVIQLDTSLLRELIYTDKGDIFFLDRRAQIIRISDDGAVNTIKTQYGDNALVIPYTLSADSEGNLYFTDVYNNKFITYAYHNGRSRIMYDLSHNLNEEQNIALQDLRNLRVFNDTTLAGHSRRGPGEYNIFATLQNDSGNVVDRVKLNLFSAASAYWFWIGLNAAGLAVVLLLVLILKSGRISIITKQLFIFLPLFLAVMLVLSLIISEIIKAYTVAMAYGKVSAVAEVKEKLLDVDELLTLNHPADDLGLEFNRIFEKNRVEWEGAYSVFYFLEDGRIFVGLSETMQSYTPIDYQFDPQTVSAYYDALQKDEIVLASTIDDLGEWMFALAPLRDSRGELVGILEQGWDAEVIYAEVYEAETYILFILAGIVVFVVIAYVIMLKYSLRALNVLKQSVAEVAAGRWDARVKIKTKDEFRDIGQAFNKMSEHIQEYINEITRLNETYFKFVPEKFISFLGKKTVLDVQSGEQVTGPMSVLYANIRNIEEQSRQMDIEENYHFVNRVLEVISRIINENQGVVEAFQGAGAIALFKERPDDALVSALCIMEDLEQLNRHGERNVELGLSISSGRVLLGIVGHENRLSTTVISDEVDNVHLLEQIGAKLGGYLLLTRETVEGLTNLEQYKYRYAGRVEDRESKRIIEVYEFLDSYDSHSQKNKLATKPMLEAGINYYQDGDFAEARKRFIEVIRMDHTDNLAKLYLFCCEKYGREKQDRWEGILKLI